MLAVQSGHNHVCGAVNHLFKDQLGLVGLEVISSYAEYALWLLRGSVFIKWKYFFTAFVNDTVSVVGTGLPGVCSIVNSSWHVPSVTSSLIVEMGGGNINDVLTELD